MASNRSKKARENLAARQADFDAHLSRKSGFKRPGSLNSKKQGAGGESGGKRR